MRSPSQDPPTFNEDEYTFDVSETSGPNETVAVIEANNPEPGTYMYSSLVTGKASFLFISVWFKIFHYHIEFNFPQYLILNAQTQTPRFPFTVDGETGRIYLTGALDVDVQNVRLILLVANLAT